MLKASVKKKHITQHERCRTIIRRMNPPLAVNKYVKMESDIICCFEKVFGKITKVHATISGYPVIDKFQQLKLIGKLVKPAMTRTYSEVFSAFPEIPRSRNRDPKTIHNNSGGYSVHFHAFRQISEASSSRVVQKSSLKSLFVFSPILALVFH